VSNQREIGIPKLLVGLAVMMLISVAGAGAEAPARLTDVSVRTTDGATSVAVTTGGVPKYHASLYDPRKLVIDFEDTTYQWRTTPLGDAADSIKEIRGSQFRKGLARLVVQLSRPAKYTVEDTSNGVLIVLNPPSTPAAPQAAAPAPARAAVKPNPIPTGLVGAPPGSAPPAPESTAPRSVAGTTTPPAPPEQPAKPQPPAPRVAAAPKPSAAHASAAAPAPAPLIAPAPAAPIPSKPAAPAPVAAAPVAPAPAPVAAAPAPVRVAQAQAPPPPPPAVAPPPPTAVPPPPQGTISATNGRRLISLDFKDADVVNLLRILAAESGRNIVVGDDVKGKMSISLRNVPWEQALETILETRGLQKVEKGNVLRLVTSEQLTKEREAAAKVIEAKLKSEAEARAKMAEAQLKEAEALQRKYAAEAAVKEAEARGPLREETIRLSYADPEEVAETLQGILGITKDQKQPTTTSTVGGMPPIAEPPFSNLYGQQQSAAAGAPQSGPVSVSQEVVAKGLTIRAHKPTHTIFLRLYAADLERIKKLIRENFDIPLPQVKIEARMEILDHNALEQIGIMWGGGAAGRAASLSLVGQGFQSGTNLGQTVASAPGVLLPDGSLLLDRVPITPSARETAGSATGQPNPNFNLQQFLPISASTGPPLGGNLINLPISALPNAGPLPAAGLAFGILAQKYNINLALQALAEQGKTRTLARPEIVTVENAKAMMSLGEEIPYATVSSAGTQIQFKEALLKLEVTPTVIRENDVNKIKMTVIVENNSRGTVVNLGNSGNPPAINKRKAETQVLIVEGQRLVVGGVATSTDANTVRKVPVLGDMPLIGWLFKQKETFEQGRELVVFVTPSVLRNPTGAQTPLPGQPQR
jgi:type IV pilus assembly protein PilQ